VTRRTQNGLLSALVFTFAWIVRVSTENMALKFPLFGITLACFFAPKQTQFFELGYLE